jgi:hypothetical protein
MSAAADKLVEAMREVLRISDRKHDAWDAAKAAIAEYEAEENLKTFAGFPLVIENLAPAEVVVIIQRRGQT